MILEDRDVPEIMLPEIFMTEVLGELSNERLVC